LSTTAAQSIKGYKLLEQIGEGAHGAVYRAQQQFVNREVAIKIILPDFASRPDFIRRFEKEAQLVAQLEHLHILPLYDYWRDPAGAYLVTRLMKGGSLSQVLKENGNLSLEYVAQLVEQIASAINAAHKQGVVHRDIKPANILLDENGNAYLSDFGIAKEIDLEVDITQTNILMGTPAYISPEQAQGLRVSPQTDIYAFGIVVYELLAGKHPFPTASTAELVAKHLNEPIPYVREIKPEIPAALDGVIQKATAKLPEDRYHSIQLLAEDFRHALDLEVGAAQTPAVDLYNPYKGLRAFQEYDNDDFFGREKLVGQLLAQLASPGKASKFLAVVGPSGSGKSSVVKAGLLPALRKGVLTGSDGWFIVEMHPGTQPIVELELALLSISSETGVNFRELISRDKHGLEAAVQNALPDETSQLLLVIDQFEELFSLLEDEAQQKFFLESLSNALNYQDSRMRVVITLRADFYDRPLMYPDFGRLVEERTEVVLPLSPEEMEAVIRKPAERVGAVLEEGLVAAIISDVADQPGALPLLQYALTELFDRREGRMLTCEAYQSIGGVLGALGRRAEEVYLSLEEEEKRAARQLFLRLVTLGEGAEDTRRRVLVSEISGIYLQNMPRVIEFFGQARLLTFDRDPETREPTIEVAHEALLNEWQRLRSWLDNSRADIRMQRVLANAANEWQAINRDPGYLLRGTRLDQFEAWAADTDLAMTEFEIDYLEASLAERRARQVQEDIRLAREAAMERRSRNFLRGLVAVLAIATIGAVILSLYAFNQRGDAQNSAATAQAEAAARATQQMVAESEADQRATQQAIAEEEASARATAEAIAVEERDKVLKQASVTLAERAQQMKELGDLELAVLLTLAALKEYPYTPQAELVLAESVMGVSISHTLQPQIYGNWLAVEWSPTAERVATALYGDYVEPSILVQDPKTGAEIINILLGVDCYAASNIAWSPAGERLVVVPRYCDFAPRIFDAHTGELQTTINNLAEQANFSAAWAPDGEALLTGSLDGVARIWDSQSGELLFEIPAHDNYITEVAWSPNGDKISTGSNDDTAKIWVVETGELLFEHAHSDDVTGLAWSPDGGKIVTVCQDSSALVLDSITGESLFSLDGHEAQIWDVAWSPDGALIATDSRDGSTRFWNALTGEYLFAFPNNSEERQVLNSISWSPNGDRVLIMGVEFNQIWDLTTREATFSGHQQGLTDAAWSPDGNSIATGSLDSTARIWEAASGQLEAALYHPAAVIDIAWSPDGMQLASIGQDGALRVWGVDSRTFDGSPIFKGYKFAELSWSPGGKRMFTSSETDQAGMIWDLETGEGTILQQGDLHCYLASPSWSPGGDRIVTGCLGDQKDTPARIWDARTGVEIQRLESVDGASQIVDWSQDGNFIVVGYSNPIVRIWDVATQQSLVRFSMHSDKLAELDFAPNSQRVVSLDIGRYLYVWDILTGEVVYRSQVPHTPTAVKWSPDGKQVIVTTITSEPVIERVWQSTGELIAFTEECCVRRELNVIERQNFGLP
jgi:WD40 repeat protein/serine/threonine protein kinase